MGCCEDVVIFHPDGRQGVDVEEAAIVELFGSNLPVGQPIPLLVE